MYQWRKFEFFEEKSGRCSIPSEVEGTVQCCSGGRNRIALGCDDGMVHILDRGFKLVSSFRAHSSNVFFIQRLKVGGRLLNANGAQCVGLLFEETLGRELPATFISQSPPF